MIETLVNNISELMSKTGTATRKSAEDITGGVQILERISDAYGDNVEQVKATSVQISKMIEKAKEVDEISGRIAEATSVQAKGTEIMLDGTEKIGNLVDEARKQSEELKERAENLDRISEELNGKMRFFKIN
ncbi:MAG: hypothetical protein K6G84_05870 [Lachnospiraceae bacterium]|nr:hypothetical protein [Lachnospiraceae bacterium]